MFGIDDLDHLSKEDITQAFLSTLKDRNFTIFGDSLQLQIFEHLIEALDLSSHLTTSIIQDKACQKQLKLVSIYHGHGGYLKYLNFYNIWDTDLSTKTIADRYFLSSKTLLSLIEHDSFNMLNFGLHYHSYSYGQLHKIIKRVTQLLA